MTVQNATHLTLSPIGVVRAEGGAFRLEVAPPYRPALAGLEGFSHLQILWWFSGCEDARSRASRTEEAPYRRGPALLGTFATRSPRRPNPIALSCAGVLGIDRERGVLVLDYLDAEDGSPVLDIKPYLPSLDRVAAPGVPGWCAHWPASVEESGDFDWGAEFSF